MIPQKTVEELIKKHSSLEKDLSLGNIEKNISKKVRITIDFSTIDRLSNA